VDPQLCVAPVLTLTVEPRLDVEGLVGDGGRLEACRGDAAAEKAIASQEAKDMSLTKFRLIDHVKV